jgi:iron(III) transport system permease protein
MRKAGGFGGAFGLLAALLLPWYLQQDGLGAVPWAGLAWLTDADAGSAVGLALAEGRWWLWPAVLAPGLALAAAVLPIARPLRASLFALAGGGGLLLWAAQGWTIGVRGWTFAALEGVFGEVERQFGVGLGGALVPLCLLLVLAAGLAGRGAFRGDPFTAAIALLVAAGVGLFTFWPLAAMLSDAFRDGDGVLAPVAIVGRLADERLWSLGCLIGGPRCGVVWNTMALATLTATGTTAPCATLGSCATPTAPAG